MPAITLRLDATQHAELTRRARLRGVSLADYIRGAALADDTAGLLRELHAAVVGRNGHGLGQEAADALAALVGMGVPAIQARKKIESIVTAQPKAGAADIIREAMRKD